MHACQSLSLVQIFFALADLPRLGVDPWETAFAQVTPETIHVLDKLNTEYGDGPPWGDGPWQVGLNHVPLNLNLKQSKIRHQGYSYLDEEFPNLDYIKTCETLGRVQGLLNN